MIDRRLKIRHLQAVAEITRHKSFKLAAESLHLTQPAISKTVRELEDIVGTAIFRRDRSGVTLTRAGEVFTSFAKASLAALQQGLDGITQIREGGRTRLTVGALPSVAARIMPDVSNALARDTPDLTLAIVDGPHAYLIEALRLGTLDLVIGRMGLPASMQGLSFTQLYTESVVAVVRPEHPLHGPCQMDDIARYEVIYPSEGSAIRPLVDRTLIAHGVGEIPQRVETVSSAYGRVLTRSSDAVWLISEGVVASEVAAGDLRVLPLNMETTLGAVGLMMRSETEVSPPIRLLLRTIESVVKAMGLTRDRR